MTNDIVGKRIRALRQEIINSLRNRNLLYMYSSEDLRKMNERQLIELKNRIQPDFFEKNRSSALGNQSTENILFKMEKRKINDNTFYRNVFFKENTNEYLNRRPRRQFRI